MIRFSEKIGDKNRIILESIKIVLESINDPVDSVKAEIRKVLELGTETEKIAELFDKIIEKSFSVSENENENLYLVIAREVDSARNACAREGVIVSKIQSKEISSILYEYHDFKGTIQTLNELF
jgi:uncharacterized membrane-anchored protein YjiN (DUF445 family)